MSPSTAPGTYKDDTFERNQSAQALFRKSTLQLPLLLSFNIDMVEAPNLLSSTKGADWDALAKARMNFEDNPTTGATAALLAETNARLPFSLGSAILDNGCGPGPVMSGLIDTYGDDISPQCSLTCSDFSEPMVAQVNKIKAQSRVERWSTVKTIVSNAMDMSAVPDDSQSHVMAGWVYFMTPDPQKCLAESRRMLRPGGVLGLTSWEDSQWLQVMSVLKEVFPDRTLPELPRKWSSESALKQEMELAGFKDVECKSVTVYMGYDTHEKIVHFLLTHIPPMIAAMKGMSKESVAKVEAAMVKRCKNFNTEEPGRFSGVTIVAVGTK